MGSKGFSRHRQRTKRQQNRQLRKKFRIRIRIQPTETTYLWRPDQHERMRAHWKRSISWRNCTHSAAHTTVIASSYDSWCTSPAPNKFIRVDNRAALLGWIYWKGAWKSIFLRMSVNLSWDDAKSQRWEFAYSQQSSQMKIGLCCSTAQQQRTERSDRTYASTKHGNTGRPLVHLGINAVLPNIINGVHNRKKKWTIIHETGRMCWM